MAYAGNVDELALLQTVRLRPSTTPEALAAHLGVSEQAATAALTALVERGRATEDERHYRLTDAGLDELALQLDAERVSIDEDSIADVLTRFEALDSEFDALVSDVDAEGFADALVALDARAQDVFDDASAFVPRLSRYQDLFAEALAKVRAGSLTWASARTVDSYAVVWSQMRSELEGAAGR